MPRLIWSREASRDLQRVRAYFLDRDPGAGARALRAIRSKAVWLERFPAAGPVFDSDTRVVSVVGTGYILLYKLQSDDLQILRVRHEREDWQ